MVALLALAGTAAAEGGKLQWRAPTIPGPAPSPAVAQEGENETTKDSQHVRTVAHEKQGKDSEKEKGPRLILPEEDRQQREQKEPRKLRSVVVRRSILADSASDRKNQEPRRPKLVLRDENVLRVAKNEANDTSSWRFPQKDPFEDQDWRTSRKRGGRSDDAQLRLAQSDGEGPSTRSVLVRDPFEDGNASARGRRSMSGRFANQPMPLDGADSAQPLGDQEEPELEGFRRFSDEPFMEGYRQDRSLEAERERAERLCAQALEVIDQDRISTIDLAIEVPGEVGVDLPFECSLDTEEYEPRNFSGITYMWKASALCHKPLYFEDVQLERYGHSWGWHVQPLVSAAHFFGTLPILPYKMGLETPNECIYALGYYRPGNCAPYLIEPLGTSPRAVVWQAGAVVGASAIIP